MCGGKVEYEARRADGLHTDTGLLLALLGPGSQLGKASGMGEATGGKKMVAAAAGPCSSRQIDWRTGSCPPPVFGCCGCSTVTPGLSTLE